MGTIIFRRPLAKNIGLPHALPTDKYTPIRSSNSLSYLKNWIKWTKNYYPKTEKRIIILDKINLFKSDSYWRGRYKGGFEYRYNVYEER